MVYNLVCLIRCLLKPGNFIAKDGRIGPVSTKVFSYDRIFRYIYRNLCSDRNGIFSPCVWDLKNLRTGLQEKRGRVVLFTAE